MSNPLYEIFGQKQAPMSDQMPNNMMEQFNQFRSMFKGDPKAVVNGLLQSGKMTQGQLNQLEQMASMFQKMVK